MPSTLLLRRSHTLVNVLTVMYSWLYISACNLSPILPSFMISTPSTRWFYAGPSILTTSVGAQWMKRWTRRRCPAMTRPPPLWWAGLFNDIPFHHSLSMLVVPMYVHCCIWMERVGERRWGQGVGWEKWTVDDGKWILTTFTILASVSVKYITVSHCIMFFLCVKYWLNGSLPE